MAEAAFNTIAEVQRLRDAGFRQEQAEAITLSIHAGVTGGVATKADLEAVRGKLAADAQALRSGIELLRKDMVAQGEVLEERIRNQGEILEKRIRSQGEVLEERIRSQGEVLQKEIVAQTASLHTEIAGFRADFANAQANHLRWLIGGIIVMTGVLASAAALSLQ